MARNAMPLWRQVGSFFCSKFDVVIYNQGGQIVLRFVRGSAYCSEAFRHSVAGSTNGSSGESSGVFSVSSVLERIVNCEATDVGSSREGGFQTSKCESTVGEGESSNEQNWLWVEEVAPLRNPIETCPSLQLSEWLEYVQDRHPDAQQQYWQGDRFVSKLRRCGLVTQVLKAMNVSRGESMNAVLAKFTGELSVHEIVLIFKGLQGKRFAFDFYVWVKQQPNYSPNRHIFTAVIYCLMISDDWMELRVVMNEMFENKLCPDNHCFNRLLRAGGLHDNRTVCDPVKLSCCEIWFRKTMKLGHKLDTSIHLVLLKAFNNEKKYKTTLSLFKGMLENCHDLLCGSYQYALIACKELTNVERAEELWNDMEARGIQPDVECYTVLISMHANNRDTDKATALFQRMQERGNVPDIQAYTCLIHAFAKAGKVHEASFTFQQLQEEGRKLDGFLCRIMMQMYMEAGLWVDVVRIFDTVKERGDQLNAFCYHLAIEACSKRQAWDQAVEIFKEMQCLRLRTGQELCCTMMQVYFMSKRYQACEQLFCYVVQKKFLNCQQAYEIAIKVYIVTRRKRHALHAFEIMQSNCCPPTGNIYRLIIPILAQTCPSNARLLYQQMQSTGELASFDNYVSLITAHVKAKDRLWAKRFYDEMKSAGFKPDKHIFRYLLSSYREAAEEEEAFRLFTDWRSSTCYPDKAVFEIMIETFIKVGKHTDAEVLLQEMLGNDLVPDMNVFMLLAKGE